MLLQVMSSSREYYSFECARPDLKQRLFSDAFPMKEKDDVVYEVRYMQEVVKSQAEHTVNRSTVP